MGTRETFLDQMRPEQCETPVWRRYLELYQSCVPRNNVNMAALNRDVRIQYIPGLNAQNSNSGSAENILVGF